MITEKDLRTFKTLLNEKIQDNLIKMPTDITTGRLSTLGNCNETLSRVDETLRKLQENCDIILQSSVVPEPHDHEMQVSQLIYNDRAGAGKEIMARFNKNANCVEFTLPKFQTIVQKEAVIGYEPWIQFEPEERDRAMDQVFIQMVDAWNEKYGTSNRK